MSEQGPPTPDELAALAERRQSTLDRFRELRRRKRAFGFGAAMIVLVVGTLAGVGVFDSHSPTTRVVVSHPPKGSVTPALTTTTTLTPAQTLATTAPTSTSTTTTTTPPPTSTTTTTTTVVAAPTTVTITSPTQVHYLTLHVGDQVRFRLAAPAGEHRRDGSPVLWPSPTVDNTVVLVPVSDTTPCPRSTTCELFKAIARGKANITVPYPGGIICDSSGSCFAVTSPAPATIRVTVTS